MALTEVLGTASYMAVRAPGTDTVELTATGTLPCLNYQAKLVQRPERVIPPMWDMVFLIERFCLTAVKPFELRASMSAANADFIQVYEASGKMEVPIIDPVLTPVDLRSLGLASQFDVYALVQSRPIKPHLGCIIVPHGSLVISIYYKAFGPAPMDECLRWKDANCARADGSAFEGGSDVPWPARGPEVPWP